MNEVYCDSRETTKLNPGFWFVVYDDMTDEGKHQKPSIGWTAMRFIEVDGIPVECFTVPGLFKSEREAHIWVDRQNAEIGIRVLYPNKVDRPEPSH